MFRYIIEIGVFKPGTCYKVTEEIAAPSIITNLLIYFDNGGTDFLKRRYNSNGLHPHTIEDHNLETLLHKNLKSHIK